MNEIFNCNLLAVQAMAVGKLTGRHFERNLVFDKVIGVAQAERSLGWMLLIVADIKFGVSAECGIALEKILSFNPCNQ